MNDTERKELEERIYIAAKKACTTKLYPDEEVIDLIAVDKFKLGASFIINGKLAEAEKKIEELTMKCETLSIVGTFKYKFDRIESDNKKMRECLNIVIIETENHPHDVIRDCKQCLADIARGEEKE